MKLNFSWLYRWIARGPGLSIDCEKKGVETPFAEDIFAAGRGVPAERKNRLRLWFPCPFFDTLMGARKGVGGKGEVWTPWRRRRSRGRDWSSSFPGRT